MKGTLTKTQRLLAYGLNQFRINEEDKLTMLAFLEQEEDQLLMIRYLQTHLQATEQEILNAFGQILLRRKNLTES